MTKDINCKNIIFDLAGVILNLNLERDSIALDEAGLPPFHLWHQYPEMSKHAFAYLNGLLSVNEFCKLVLPFCRKGITRSKLLWAMDAVLDGIPENRFELLKELKKGYKVYLLSNIYESAWNYVLGLFHNSGYTLDDCFHKVFLSYELQLAKPDKKIYQYVIESENLNPNETIFFDDSKENLEEAKKIGIHTMLVPNNCLEDIISVLF